MDKEIPSLEDWDELQLDDRLLALKDEAEHCISSIGTVEDDLNDAIKRIDALEDIIEKLTAEISDLKSDNHK